MSAILYIGGVLYLLAVNYQVGKHYDRDFDLWTRRIRHATMSGIYMSVPHDDAYTTTKQTVPTGISQAAPSMGD